MIELSSDALVFSFPDVHPEAKLRIEFQRTLRIPDDGRDHPLPPGLGAFPIRHVDDFAARVPPEWLEHGGVMLPMYQAEALWLNFHGEFLPGRGTQYPFAIRVATGKIDAVTGQPWAPGLGRKPQNYMVHPEQPWLDGYCVERGVIRQFVAMPLGEGYTAEEQVTGKGEHGGLQIQVFPMRRGVFERRFKVRPEREETGEFLGRAIFSKDPTVCESPMGLTPGGRMRQEIYEDSFDLADWDLAATGRCFVHLLNSAAWRGTTGENPPTRPPTAADYSLAGLPWFNYYDEGARPLPGSGVLRGLKSVLMKGNEKGATPLPANDGTGSPRVVELRRGLRAGQVREGVF